MTAKCFDNRELSWLKFNLRVLEEARDPNVPLFERLTFASIFQSNLDEFFMVRVGSISDRMRVDPEYRENKTNMTGAEQLDAIFKRVSELVPLRDSAYADIMKELEKFNIHQIDFKSISKEEEKFLHLYFNAEIRPLISPQILDKRHPFPFLRNKDIYAVAHLESKSGVKIGLIPCNTGVFERLIFLPGDKLRFILVEELILHYMPQVFDGFKVLDKSLIRVTRNADINVDEALYDHEMDFRDIMETLIKNRKKLSPVRMELSRGLGSAALDFLCEQLELGREQLFMTKSPLDLSFVFALGDKVKDIGGLFYEKLTSQPSRWVNSAVPMIRQIQQKDILLSYPYESIKPFIRLLNEAAEDPLVVSIKITLYRVAKSSQVVAALIKAAENGKDVLVLVELRARFDEENNIEWSKRLEEAGCTVIYGLEGMKVHSKLLLITRKNKEKVEYITQIGTGNYNEKTSRLYTDLSLMTANTDIALEAGTVFNALSMGNPVTEMQHLLVAPNCLQNKILAMMDKEIQTAKLGNPAYIGVKCNSLSDKDLIEKLIEASRAGVKIDMIIRGINCMVAGVPGYTENITVRSIVGRFLEHSRIYIFGTPERQQLYISSADYMTRNTTRRVEVATPIYDPDIRQRIYDMFTVMLRDNVKARIQQPDGSYVKQTIPAAPLDSQIYFYEQAYENAKLAPTTAPDEENSKGTFTSRIKAAFRRSKGKQ